MRGFVTGILSALLLAAPAVAEQKAVVVELFTSQGCSSCPPADEFLHELAKHDDIVALALHVDYWDYIGWKDSFALPEHAVRQRAYAAVNGRRVIYTPQMVINGSDHVVGNSPRDVADVIEQHRKQPQTVDIRLSRDGGEVVVEADPMTDIDTPLTVQLVRYTPSSTVKITRGENAGRTISYANVVTEITQLGVWKGDKPLRLKAPVSGEAPVVVLMQQLGGAGIVQAAAKLQ